MSKYSDREPETKSCGAKQDLTQNQVESLVKAMETLEPGAVIQHQPAETCGVVDSDSALEPGLLAAVTELHESIAIKLTTSLSEMLRAEVQVSVARTEQVPATQIQRQLHSFGWQTALTSSQCCGWLLNIPPETCCAIVDRMLGGEPVPGETFTRPMTDIEQRLIGRLVDELLAQIKSEWAHVTELSWNASHHHSHISAVQPSEVTFVDVQFMVAMASVQGAIHLAIPATAIIECSRRLQDANVRNPPSESRVNQNVAGAPIDVVVTLADSTISTSDLLDLSVGDVIATEKGVNESLELAIQGIPKFQVRPGALRGKKAVQVDQLVKDD